MSTRETADQASSHSLIDPSLNARGPADSATSEEDKVAPWMQRVLDSGASQLVKEVKEFAQSRKLIFDRPYHTLYHVGTSDIDFKDVQDALSDCVGQSNMALLSGLQIARVALPDSSDTLNIKKPTGLDSYKIQRGDWDGTYHIYTTSGDAWKFRRHGGKGTYFVQPSIACRQVEYYTIGASKEGTEKGRSVAPERTWVYRTGPTVMGRPVSGSGPEEDDSDFANTVKGIPFRWALYKLPEMIDNGSIDLALASVRADFDQGVIRQHDQLKDRGWGIGRGQFPQISLTQLQRPAHFRAVVSTERSVPDAHWNENHGGVGDDGLLLKTLAGGTSRV